MEYLPFLHYDDTIGSQLAIGATEPKNAQGLYNITLVEWLSVNIVSKVES